MDLLAGFLAEAQDYVDKLRASLGGGDLSSELSEVHRCWHTLAGAAEMLDLESLAVLARPAEEMVEAVLDSGAALLADQIADLMQRLDATQAEIIRLGGNVAAPPDFMAIFALEASEHNQSIATQLAALRENPANTAATSELRRVIHTFKGAAGSVGLGDLARLAHLMEDLLDRALENHLDHTSLDLLIDAADALAQPFESQDVSSDFLASIETRFAALLGDLYTPPPQAAASSDVPQTVENVLRIPQTQIDRLVNRVGEIVINRAALEGFVHSLDFLLAELEHTTKRLQRVSQSLDAQIKTVSKDTQDPDFDPLELEQYSLLYQHTRELEEIAADTGNINSQLHLISDDFETGISRERRLTSDVQDGLISTRLVPFREIETRLQRIVHRTAKDLGKEALFQLIGGETKVDKTVLLTLTDPLMHLLRNAVDHGIESPPTRRAASKPPIGQITLTVSRERSRVIIRLSDDGGGIDLDAVRAHAIEQGLISRDDPVDHDSLLALLFTEGFSLSKTVSQISGRGLGLDVAEHAVRQLQGTIRVATSPGHGTTFTLSVPITLAITRALFIRCEGQVFAVPLEQIAGVIRVEPNHHREIEDEQVLRHKDRILRVYNLAAYIHHVSPYSVRNARYGLVIEQAEQDVVVLVDALQGTHDSVVKSLGTHLRRVPGVAGATVAGDGSVVLILDLLEVVGGKSVAEDTLPIPTNIGQRCVLVVDDSLSVRRVVCSFLERAGWQTLAAKDGIEALDRMAQTRPDAALVDIEMPRMNGYELLSSMRSDPALRAVPVIFLTSRSAGKHRDRAAQLGVNGYLVKPYQESELLAELNRVIQGVEP